MATQINTEATQLILSKEGAHYLVILEPDESDDRIQVKRIHSNGGKLINEKRISPTDLQEHVEFYTSRGFSLQVNKETPAGKPGL